MKVQWKKGKRLETTFCKAEEYGDVSVRLVGTGPCLLKCVKSTKRDELPCAGYHAATAGSLLLKI